MPYINTNRVRKFLNAFSPCEIAITTFQLAFRAFSEFEQICAQVMASHARMRMSKNPNSVRAPVHFPHRGIAFPDIALHPATSINPCQLFH
jgi:hypothetical protein